MAAIGDHVTSVGSYKLLLHDAPITDDGDMDFKHMLKTTYDMLHDAPITDDGDMDFKRMLKMSIIGRDFNGQLQAAVISILSTCLKCRE